MNRSEGKLKSSKIILAGIFALLISVPVAAQSASNAPPQTSAGDSKSPSARVGLFVNPKSNQTPEQQAADEKICYATAQQQTGIDPSASPAPPPEAAKKKTGGAKGAARGAAGGAAIGGDAGTGAAVGATAGAVRGRRQQKKANKEAEQQAAQQSQAQQKQQLDTFRRAFSSCIDAKGYSVK